MCLFCLKKRYPSSRNLDINLIFMYFHQHLVHMKCFQNFGWLMQNWGIWPCFFLRKHPRKLQSFRIFRRLHNVYIKLEKLILKLYHREIVIFIFEKLHNGWDLQNVNQRMFFDFSFKECLKPFENVEVVHTKWLLIINFEIEWCPSFQMGSS